jgi:hypothetical protein
LTRTAIGVKAVERGVWSPLIVEAQSTSEGTAALSVGGAGLLVSQDRLKATRERSSTAEWRES